ncbi:MAG: branched-chain amino acid ABC transporter permease [Burkholderiaceae bacterium]|jgi:branched-chain amino acid transport system permease protein|nr:branched-chain amino acid ABC transporter permease [Burkholderiaceae bacterium]
MNPDTQMPAVAESTAAANHASTSQAITVERWSPVSKTSVIGVIAIQCLLALAPFFLGAGTVDRLTTLFIYGILALMWNALAGYAGLVSVGHQAFFGLGAYAAIRLAAAGMNPYLALVLAAVAVAILAIPMSTFMARLRDSEFAIGMWVIAALAHLLVNLDTLVQGETGTSLISLQSYAPAQRRMFTYWLALGAMAGLAWCVFGLLRGKVGNALQAIRDNEEAATSIGVRVLPAKQLIFVLSAFGCAMAGALWLATVVTFQPAAYFNVQWTAYMLFMALVGGIGTYEGPIIGAVLFFGMETAFGATGVTYLIGLGLVAVIFALVLPKGIWGAIETKFGIQLLPVGYRLRSGEAVFNGLTAGLVRKTK